jgi:uncharacterized membrane protein YdjX (TVP38/TMEM64 family)
MTVQTRGSRESDQASLWSKHGQKLVAAAFWLLLIGGYGWYYQANELTTESALLQIVNLLDSPFGPLLYILIYALRPLIFFSAAVLTVASGAIFGAGSIVNLALAVLYTVIGSNLSATVAYYIGRFFGQGLLQQEAGESGGMLQRYADRMRQNSFETIMIMRFIFLPYDLVNYLAGILRIDWKAFILASLLGSIPGTIAFVSFGASIDIKELAMGKAPQFDPWVLVFGVAIFIVSIVISRYFKKRETMRS